MAELTVKLAKIEYLKRLALRLEDTIPTLSSPDEIEYATNILNRVIWEWTRLSCSKWK